MARRCSVCVHPLVSDINIGLARGAEYRGLARKYTVGEDAIARHHLDHLPAALAEAAKKRDIREALDVVHELELANRATKKVLKDALNRGALNTSLLAVDRLVKQVELVLRVTGELDERPTNQSTTNVNIALAPIFALVQRLAAKLADPADRQELLDELEVIELGSGSGSGGGAIIEGEKVR